MAVGGSGGLCITVGPVVCRAKPAGLLHCLLSSACHLFGVVKLPGRHHVHVACKTPLRWHLVPPDTREALVCALKFEQAQSSQSDGCAVAVLGVQALSKTAENAN